MNTVITNPYHISIVKNIISHKQYKYAPVFYIVDLVQRLFPEYRDQVLEKDLLCQIDAICLGIGK